ncbi:MAG: M48 family metalloprotease, partial [Planctomycetota bacterium]
MGLPFPFLAGLLVLFAHRELQPVIPGSGEVDRVAVFALLLAVPSLLAVLSLLLIRRQLIQNWRPPAPPRALLRLSAGATPVVLYLLLGTGSYAACIDQWVASSHFADIALLMLPLLATEFPRILLGTATMLCCEIDEEVAGGRRVPASMLPSLRDVLPVARLRLGWPLLVTMPCLLLGAGLDLLQIDRELYVFCLGTSLGSTLGTIAFLGLASVVLPYWFRVAFGTVGRLPEPVGQQLRRTAAALGFNPARVLLLPTGMRALNAMMVGPLPAGRCLCLTDGLLRALDAESLAGVVAHEIGHARRGHPRLLMALVVVVPLLLMNPLRLLDLDAID